MYWEHWVPGGIILLHFIQLSFSLRKHMLVPNWDDTLQKKMTLILKIIKKKIFKFIHNKLILSNH